MKKLIAAVCALIVLIGVLLAAFYIRFPRKYREIAEHGEVPSSLVYAVMKAESGFREDAVSSAGAVGLMQLMPSTAQFVCMRTGIPYEEARLKEGAYNAELGVWYLTYLLEKFASEDAAICAYNAGEGVVMGWLTRPELSPDGVSLARVPYAETSRYLKKVKNFRKIYEFLYP